MLSGYELKENEMRKTMFGDTVIESAEDDMGLIEALQDAGDDIYAVVRANEDGSGKYDFEIMNNEDGEVIISSDPIFDSQDAAKAYLRGWVSDIQVD